MNVYKIHEDYLDRLTKKLATIQKKCDKLGCSFHYEEVGEEFKTVIFNGMQIPTRYVLVEAEGVAIVNGWKLIASLEHTENGNVIRSVCDTEIPSRYYDCPAVCEHCKSNRPRKNTFLVQNLETGEIKQVGRSCLREFTGGLSAEMAAECVSMMDTLSKGEEMDLEIGGPCKVYVRTKMYLACAAEAVRVFGYAKSSEGYDSTKSRALRYYRAVSGYKTNDDVREEMEENGIDPKADSVQKVAEDAAEWISWQEERSTFMHNLKTIAGTEYTSDSNIGFLASLIPTYYREMEKQKQKQETASESEWVGEVGKRVEIKVAECQVLTGWETAYGWTNLLSIKDTEGNVYTWKTSGSVAEGTKTIKGTVKSHREYRGTKQTELTRCRCYK